MTLGIAISLAPRIFTLDIEGFPGYEMAFDDTRSDAESDVGNTLLFLLQVILRSPFRDKFRLLQIGLSGCLQKFIGASMVSLSV